MVSIRERETVEVWARFAGACRRLRWVFMAKGGNPSLPRPRKTIMTTQFGRSSINGGKGCIDLGPDSTKVIEL